MITFQRPDGKSSRAHLVEPVHAKNAPGVVVSCGDNNNDDRNALSS